MSVCIYYSVLAYCFFSIDKTNAPTLSISTAIYPYYLTNIGLTISPKNTSYRLKPHCRPCKGLSTVIDCALHAVQAPSTVVDRLSHRLQSPINNYQNHFTAIAKPCQQLLRGLCKRCNVYSTIVDRALQKMRAENLKISLAFSRLASFAHPYRKGASASIDGSYKEFNPQNRTNISLYPIQ